MSIGKVKGKYFILRELPKHTQHLTRQTCRTPGRWLKHKGKQGVTGPGYFRVPGQSKTRKGEGPTSVITK